MTQENVLMATLTVREAIYYSAQIQLPDTMPVAEKLARAGDTIQEMGLTGALDTRIGGREAKGISGGQRKRLSICLEILTRPRLLFLDEPTTGLDSAAAFSVVQTLRQLAVDGGRTIVSSVHQPSSEVFALFDDLCLLSSGECVYFGDAKLATQVRTSQWRMLYISLHFCDTDMLLRNLCMQFFAETGFPCPSRRNPSDHFLRCVNSDFDDVAATMKGSMKLRAVRGLNSEPSLLFHT